MSILGTDFEGYKKLIEEQGLESVLAQANADIIALQNAWRPKRKMLLDHLAPAPYYGYSDGSPGVHTDLVFPPPELL